MLGFDQSERHRVRRGAGTAELAGERFHQRNDAAAGSGNDREAGFADTRGVADDADDAAVLRAVEVRRGRMTTVDRAIKASVDLAAPILGRALDEGLANSSSGIVDQDVEAAKVCCDLVDHAFDGAEIGDVGAVSFGVAALSGNLLHNALCVVTGAAVVDRNARAFGCQTERNFATDAAGRARHQRDLSIQRQVHVCSLMFLLRFGRP